MKKFLSTNVNKQKPSRLAGKGDGKRTSMGKQDLNQQSHKFHPRVQILMAEMKRVEFEASLRNPADVAKSSIVEDFPSPASTSTARRGPPSSPPYHDWQLATLSALRATAVTVSEAKKRSITSTRNSSPLFGPIDLATILSLLAKSSSGMNGGLNCPTQIYDEFLKAWIDAVRPQIEDFDERALSNVLHALGRLWQMNQEEARKTSSRGPSRVVTGETMEASFELFMQAASVRIAEFSTQGLCSCVHGVVAFFTCDIAKKNQVSWSCEAALHSFLAAWMEQVISILDVGAPQKHQARSGGGKRGFTPQGSSMVLWSIAKLLTAASSASGESRVCSHDRPVGLLTLWLQSVGTPAENSGGPNTRQESAKSGLQNFSPQQLSTSLYALALLVGENGCLSRYLGESEADHFGEKSITFIDDRAVCIADGSPEAHPPHCLAHTVDTFLRNHWIPTAINKLPQFNPQDLSTSVWALANLRDAFPLPVPSEDGEDGAEDEGSRILEQDAYDSFLVAWFNQLEKREARASFNAHDLTNCGWAVAKLTGGPAGLTRKSDLGGGSFGSSGQRAGRDDVVESDLDSLATRFFLDWVKKTRALLCDGSHVGVLSGEASLDGLRKDEVPYARQEVLSEPCSRRMNAQNIANCTWALAVASAA